MQRGEDLAVALGAPKGDNTAWLQPVGKRPAQVSYYDIGRSDTPEVSSSLLLIAFCRLSLCSESTDERDLHRIHGGCQLVAAEGPEPVSILWMINLKWAY